MTEPFDMSRLLAQAQEMQQQLASAQEEAARTLVEGQAGGGVVRVTMTAGGEVKKVDISPEVVDPDDVEMLEDLIVAALHDAAIRAAEVQAEAMGPLGDLGGLDLGGLGDLGPGDLGGLLG